jgi:hypothetical protein
MQVQANIPPTGRFSKVFYNFFGLGPLGRFPALAFLKYSTWRRRALANSLVGYGPPRWRPISLKTCHPSTPLTIIFIFGVNIWEIYNVVKVASVCASCLGNTDGHETDWLPSTRDCKRASCLFARASSLPMKANLR